ncbi:MAG: 1,4-dihydroxy-2-naphthoate octaprenyltransferase [Flavobacteriales bacterium]
MPTPKDWISAMRLRTLPLAASSAIAGAASAFNYGTFNWFTFAFILLTTLFLQILSNLANDLGDAIKGTDDENRLGPVRGIQSGAISETEMKRMTILFAVVSFLLGLTAIHSAFETINWQTLLFVMIGIAAIASAMKYTLGKNPYGYSGLGDVFVFVFFGLVGVVGTDYLLSGTFHWSALLPAYTVGVFSAAVLNLNNLRDHKNDKLHGKNTIVVKLGLEKAKEFHFFLVVSGMISLAVFLYLSQLLIWFAFLVFLIPTALGKHLNKVMHTKNEKLLDPELKKVALTTFGTFIMLFIIQFITVYDVF